MNGRVSVRAMMAVLLLAAVLAAVSPADAVIYNWNNTVTSGRTWGDAANWNTGTDGFPNAVDAAVVFNQNITATTTVGLGTGTGFTLGSLTLTDSTPSNNWTIGGAGSTAPLIFQTSSGPATINVTTGSSNQISTAPITLNSDLTANISPSTLLYMVSGNFNVGGSFSTLRVSGGGTLAVNRTSAYAGNANVVIDSGSTLRMIGAATLFSGGVYNVNGTLDLQGSGAGSVQTVAGITGSGLIQDGRSSAGDLSLTINTPTGVTNTLSGTFQHALTAQTLLTKTGAGTQVFSGPILKDPGAAGSVRSTITVNQGTLVLSNPTGNTYNAPTTISGGTLTAMNTSGSATGTANVGVASGGTLAGSGFLVPDTASKVTVASGGILSPHAGTGQSYAQLGFSGGSGGAPLVLSSGAVLGYNLGPGGTDSINVAGTLALPAAITLNVAPQTGFGYGYYTLASATTLTGTPTCTINGLTGFDATVLAGTDLGYVANLVTLRVGSTAGTTKWTGATNGLWATGANWTQAYANNFNVNFDNTGSNPAITVAAGGVTPGLMTFVNDASHDYTFSGGAVGGAAALYKSGAGKVTFNNSTAGMTGNATINGGTVVASTALGSGSITLGDATLQMTGTGAVITSQNIVLGAATSTILLSDAGRTWTTNGVISGSGMLNKDGLGTLVLNDSLANPNTYSGGTTIRGGTLAANSLGSGPLTIGAGTLRMQRTSTRGGTVALTDLNASTIAVDDAQTYTLKGQVAAPASTTLTKDGLGTLVLNNLTNAFSNLKVKAGTVLIGTDASGNTGALGITGGTITLSGGNLQFAGNAPVAGLRGQYYNGAPDAAWFASLPALMGHFSPLTPNLTNVLSTTGGQTNFDFNNANGMLGTSPFANQGWNTGQNYSVLWDGVLNVPAPGTYTFTGASDDGSFMWIDGQQVVNNNFSQPYTAQSGTATLAAGPHSITLAYYQGTGNEGLVFSSNLNGTDQPLANSMLSYAPTLNYAKPVFMTAASTITLPATNSIAMGTLQMQGFKLTVGGGASGNVLSFASTDLGSLGPTPTAFDVGANATVDPGPITAGTLGLTKSGGGILALTANNIYTGTTTIDGGTITIAADTGLGNAANGLTINNGTLHVAATGATNRTITLGNAGSTISVDGGQTYTVNNSFAPSSTGALGKAGGGTLVIPATTALPNNTTNVNVSAGTLDLGGSARNVGNVNVGGGTLQNGTAPVQGLSFVVTSGTVAASLADQAGKAPAALVKSGPGTAVITGQNTYSGGTTVSDGTLKVSDNGTLASGTVTMSGGTLSFNPLRPGLMGTYFGGYGGSTPDVGGNVNQWDINNLTLSQFNANMATQPVGGSRNTSVRATERGVASFFQEANITQWDNFQDVGGHNYQSDTNNFVAKFTGFFNAPVAGNYYFRIWGDDRARLWLDNSDATTLLNNQSATFYLTPGLHPITLANEEWGGGDWLAAEVQGPAGSGLEALQRIPNFVLCTGPDSTTINNDILVTANSTIDVQGALQARFNRLTLNAGKKLATTGNQVQFSTTTLATGASSDYYFDINGTDLTTGTFSDGGRAVTIHKTGTGTLALSDTTIVPTLNAGTVFSVTAGKLLIVGQAAGVNPLGSASISLEGGALMLAGKDPTLTLDLDNPLTKPIAMGTTASIGAGGDYAGQGGAVANGIINVNGTTHGLSVPAGKALNLFTQNGYTLNINAPLTNNGTLAATAGPVHINALANAGTLTASGGGNLIVGSPLATGLIAPANGGTVTLNGVYSGPTSNLVPAVGGSVVLGAANSLTDAVNGPAVIAGGVFLAGNRRGFGDATLTFAGGSLGAATAMQGPNAILNPMNWASDNASVIIVNNANIDLGGPMDLGPTGTKSITDTAGRANLAGVISGTATLNYTGNGTISGRNTYSGGTILNVNTNPVITNNKAFGSGLITFNNGGFHATTPLTGDSAIANPYTFGGTAAVWFQGTNALELSGPGMLPAGNNAIHFAHPTMTTILSGVISGPGALVYANDAAYPFDGTLIMTGQNTFSGGFTLQSLVGNVDVRASTIMAGSTITSGPLGTGMVTMGSANQGYIRLANNGSTAVTLANPFTIYDGAGYDSVAGLTLSGPVTLSGPAGAGILQFWTTGNFAISGPISGVGKGVNMYTGGALGTSGFVLSNPNNSYDGQTSVTQGYLVAGGNAPASGLGVFGNSTGGAILLGDGATAAADKLGLLVNGPYTIGRGVTVANLGGGTTLGGTTNDNSIFSGAIGLAKSVDIISSATGANAVHFSGALTGAGGMNIVGPGNVTFDSTVTASYTGATNLNGGTFQLDAPLSGLAINGGTLKGLGAIGGSFSLGNRVAFTLAGASDTTTSRAALPAISSLSLTGSSTLVADNTGGTLNRLPDTAAVNVNNGGGTLLLKGAAGGSSESVGQLNLGGGAYAGALTVQLSNGGVKVLTFNGLNATRTGGSTMNFSGLTGNKAMITGQPVGFIGGFATVGTEFATYDAGNGVMPLATYGSNINTANPADDVKLNTAVMLTKATGTVHSLNLQGTGVALDLLGNTLQVDSGGVLATGGASSILPGTLQTVGSDMDFHVNDPASVLTVSANIGRIGSAFAVAKAGAGKLSVSGSIATTGPIVVSGGILEVARDGTAFSIANNISGGGTFSKTGSADLTLSANNLGFYGNMAVTGSKLIGGTASGVFGSNAATMTLTNGSLQFGGGGANTYANGRVTALGTSGLIADPGTAGNNQAALSGGLDIGTAGDALATLNLQYSGTATDLRAMVSGGTRLVAASSVLSHANDGSQYWALTGGIGKSPAATAPVGLTVQGGGITRIFGGVAPGTTPIDGSVLVTGSSLLSIDDNATLGTGSLTVDADSGLAFRQNGVALTNSSLTQAPGSFERWIGLARLGADTSAAASVNMSAGVDLSFQANVFNFGVAPGFTAANPQKTIVMNGGSVDAVNGTASGDRPGTVVMGSGVKFVLNGDSSFGGGSTLTTGYSSAGLVINGPVLEQGGSRKITKVGSTSLAFNGVNAISGGFISDGTGGVTFGPAAVGITGGPIVVNGDTVTFQGSGNFPATSTLAINGGSVALQGSTHAVASLAGTGNLALGGACTPTSLTVGSNGLDTVFSGNITGGGLGSLTKVGGGTLTLGGANTIASMTIAEGKVSPMTESSLASNVTLAGGTIVVPSYSPGIMEGYLSNIGAGIDPNINMIDTPATWAPQMGTRMANAFGDGTNGWGHQETWVYKGKFNWTGGPVTFGWNVDDGGGLRIDGQNWMTLADGSPTPGGVQFFGGPWYPGTQDIAAWCYGATKTLSAGLHDIEFRVGNNDGPAGAGWNNGTFGFGYDPQGRPFTPYSPYDPYRPYEPDNLLPLVDPGDGSLLRIGAASNFTSTILAVTADSTLDVSQNANDVVTFGGLSIGNQRLHITGQTASRLAISGLTTLTGGNAVFDVNAMKATLASTVSGPGGLTKDGNGSLTLAAANTYSGGTTVSGGAVLVTGSLPDNGSNKVSVAKDANGVLNDGNGDALIIRRVAAKAAYAGMGSAITNLSTGELPTCADILAGNASAQADVSMAWRTRTAAEKTPAGGGLIGEVLDLRGITYSTPGNDQTDTFVLQMSYNEGELARIWGITEGQAVAQDRLYLGSLDLSDHAWHRAVDGDFGGTAHFVGDHPYSSSYFTLGNYGVDTTNNVVWAVVNHNSQFAAVPEPSTLALLGLSFLGGSAWMWRRNRAPRAT